MDGKAFVQHNVPTSKTDSPENKENQKLSPIKCTYKHV